MNHHGWVQYPYKKGLWTLLPAFFMSGYRKKKKDKFCVVANCSNLSKSSFFVYQNSQSVEL